MKVFITGITGTIGTALARLHHEQGDEVVGIARSESKIVQWLRDNPGIAQVFSMDVFDLNTMSGKQYCHLASSDRCYHLAALKHVDLCERQIDEACHQNINRTGILSCVCVLEHVPFILISSDKACMPENVYGATKFIAEREVLSKGGAVVRLGNIIGSSGSVFQLWKEAAEKKQPILLTDPMMTRFFIPVQEAAHFLITEPISGKIIAPRMKGICMGKVATRICERYPGSSIQIIGSRPGETRHQWVFPPNSSIKQELGGRLILEPGWTPTNVVSNGPFEWNVDELLKVAGVFS